MVGNFQLSILWFCFQSDSDEWTTYVTLLIDIYFFLIELTREEVLALKYSINANPVWTQFDN